jgi:hypothetical protein
MTTAGRRLSLFCFTPGKNKGRLPVTYEIHRNQVDLECI